VSSVNRDFYLIRQVGSEDYSSGYGGYAVPKLYTKGAANSVVAKKNKDAQRHDEHNIRITTERGGDVSKLDKFSRWEVVPVTLLIL
jgi:hypothetical protein